MGPAEPRSLARPDRVEIRVLAATSLMWMVALYFLFEMCLGGVRECESNPVASLEGAIGLSLPLWLATFSLRWRTVLAQAIRVLCLLLLGAILILSFGYVSSALSFWSVQSLGFLLMEAGLLYAPYFMGIVSALLLARRIVSDYSRRRRPM